jgi:hypothetical protein
MASPRVYYIPEYHMTNQSFFAKSARLIAPSPTRLSGFRLWAFADSLSEYSAPVTVVAEESRGSESYFYEVTFPSPPNFSAFGLAISADFVIFMPRHELLKHTDAIPVLDNSWVTAGDRYHTVGALYYLGVLRAVPASIGQDASGFDSLEVLFQQAYGVKDPMPDSLRRLFADAHFALGLFGFLETESGSERRAFEYAEAVADQGLTPEYRCMFPFGCLRSAIRRYHEQCQEGPSDTFRPDTFMALQDSVRFVSDLLANINVVVQEDDFKTSLLRELRGYRLRRRIKETVCGPVTIRSLLFETLHDGADWLRAAGTAPTDPPAPGSDDKLDGGGRLEEFIDRLPPMARQQQALTNAVADAAGQTHRMAELVRERIAGCRARVGRMTAMIGELTEMNKLVDVRLESAEEVLDDLLEQNTVMQEKIVLVNRRIGAEEASNRSLVFCGICIFLLVVVRLFF